MGKSARCFLFVLVPLTVLGLAACSGLKLGKAQAVGEGGFSFRPVAGFTAYVEDSQVTLRSQDEKIDFILAGRSSCGVKPVLDEIDGFVHMFTRDFEEFEASEPHPISVAGKAGLFVDVTGTRFTYVARGRIRNRITGRAVLITPSDSQYFWVFASVADGTGGDRWETEGQKAFNAVMSSIDFFEPTNTLSAFPCFVNHTPPPEAVVDWSAFTDAGCTFDDRGWGTCQSNSPLAELGCEAIEDPFGGLEPSYPVATCWERFDSNEPRCGFVANLHPTGFRPFCYVMLQDDQFILMETEDAFRETFAPIETDEEALNYVLALMDGRPIENSLRPYYGLQLKPDLEYAVDVIEDTHVKKATDGYLVNLYQWDSFSCVDTPSFYAVDLHVTFQGYVEQISRKVIYSDPSGPCFY